jgi:hypothetical protein
VNVAVADGASYVTVPETAAPPPLRVNAGGCSDAATIPFENVALTVALTSTLVALDAGLVEATAGVVETVVKLQLYAARRGPPA